MLVVYGALLPLRVLEEIRFWKMQEREHTVVIRELVPNLEPDYVRLLERWEGVFAHTEAEAGRWIEALIRQPSSPSPYLTAQIHELLRASTVQSQAFIQQLFLLLKQSAPIKANPVVQTVVLHIIRESEYFLGVLQAVQEQGQGLVQPPMKESSRSFETASVPSPSQEDPPLVRAAAEQDKVHIHLAPTEEEAGRTATLEGTWSTPIPSKQAGQAATAGSAQPAPPAQGGTATGGKAVPIGEHRLPPLPYAYQALEPYIDAETMRIHHDKHHKSYVDGLNKAEKKLQQARQSGDFDLVKHWERELAFHGAGHYLHTIFWNVMKPGGGGKATGPIAEEIRKSFGSFEAFRKQFSAAADKVEGGGWAILVWSPRSHRLEILQAEKHQNLSQWDVIPLLPLDVWEHAYYLKHQNDRAKYIEDWWHTVNWDHVNERFSAARTLAWPPY
ncbi:Fe-Mn family superoxide dismutase [Paenibacillus puerhi]|uniref:Fe-Mn family superoxide dismutase n=1 Tax=Paenibacillus puerhi TaxID=2692622 RepID=UPI0013570B66|nr:Fe-Mn family superoxide dismutase [Paenibacillus puerhi]